MIRGQIEGLFCKRLQRLEDQHPSSFQGLEERVETTTEGAPRLTQRKQLLWFVTAVKT